MITKVVAKEVIMKIIKTAFYLSLAVAISACGEKPTVQSHLANAEKYHKENKLKETEIELKNAIRLDPNNAEARFAFGRLYLEQGAGLSAIKELEKAQALKYDEKKLITLLARAYLISDDHDGVITLAEKTSSLANESKVEYLSYKTLSAIRTSQIDIAKQAVEEADSLIAGNPHAILANGYMALFNNEAEKAEMLVSKSLSVYQDNPEAIMFQGQVFAAQSNFEEASNSYKKYAKLQPQSKIIYLILADTLVRTANYIEAEEYADLILKALPNQPIANYSKAVVRFAEKDLSLIHI